MKKEKYNEHAGVVIDVTDGSLPNFKNFNLDKRCNKPFAVYAEDVDTVVTYIKTFNATISGHSARFALPNEISISLSILEKSWGESEILKEKIIEIAKNDKPSLMKDKMEAQFDFIEKIYTAIIFSYKSVESFCNASIPDEYTYKITNNKGITEVYKKKEIERWLKTSEKITQILPDVFSCSNPNEMKFWPHFKELEKLRNEIVHSKSKATVDIFLNLISKNIEACIFSSIRILEFFHEKYPNNEHLPFNFGETRIRLEQVKKFTDCMDY